jgi:hypothetical protein
LPNNRLNLVIPIVTVVAIARLRLAGDQWTLSAAFVTYFKPFLDLVACI